MKRALSRRAVLAAGATLFGLSDPPMVAAANLRFEIYIPKNRRNDFWWRLKAANGQTIATSGEGYKTKAGCRVAIERIINEAATATIEDLTGKP
jgi:uncharacterized protein YegP (UPF0339 family)